MDTRGNTASYANARPPTIPTQIAPDSYQQKRSSSYRRPIEPQPIPANNPPNSVPSNSARPVAAPSSVPNGVYRASSHRRRQSQQIPPPAAPVPVSYTPPAAPEVPRGPPPTSYRDPYAPKGSARSHLPTRTYSGRSRDPTIQVNLSRQQPNIQPLQNPGAGSQLESVLPLDPLLKGVTRRDSARRPSVPERSPLQTLEGKLDDISKEERRARMEEAEWAAQKKAEAERQARRAREAAAQQQRNVSGPLPMHGRAADPPVRNVSARRHVSMPIQGTERSPRLESPIVDISEPWDPSGTADGPQARSLAAYPPGQTHKLHHVDGAVARVPSIKGKEPVGVNRGPSYHDRTGSKPPRMTEQNAYPINKRSAIPAPKGLGLYGINDPPHAHRPVGGSISHYESQRLSKDLPPTPNEKATGIQKARDSRGILAAQKEMEQQRSNNIQHPTAVSSGTQPTELPRHKVGFATADPITPSDTTPRPSQDSDQHDSKLWSHDPDRRYQPRPLLEDWKSAPSAQLLVEDLDLEIPEPAPDGAKTAWWEQSEAERKRRSSSYQPASYDGYVDEPSGETSFNPPLYLKCGPLLRYTGIRKEKRMGKEREIWRGSVMIVTTDADSSYVKPPTLRLFKQPMDLLPPPPEEIPGGGPNLNPAYVDPIEGQIKMSRTGKTLYVKPIEDILQGVDLSRVEDDTGLFTENRIALDLHSPDGVQGPLARIRKKDGEKLGKVREIPGVRLHAEQGVTFWRFNLEIELCSEQTRIAYRINRGPATGFWVPARGESMNIMFHSCNGFSLSVDSKDFCGPDPLWRDVLNNHQTRPFHVMIGGGDQIYNDAAMRQTTIFRKWTESRNPLQKHDAPFSEALQEELEKFYLERYSMWFSQGLFGMANSQIPMVNIWDDHDIIDVSADTRSVSPNGS